MKIEVGKESAVNKKCHEVPVVGPASYVQAERAVTRICVMSFEVM